MSLKITNQNGTFNLEGQINSTTADNFQKHMEYMFQQNTEVFINIDNINEIDTKGITVLRSLYMHALTHNKSFYILGQGCKEIYHDFRHANVA